MIRIKYLLTIVSMVLLTSCGNSSQKLNGEQVSVGAAIINISGLRKI